MDESGTPLGILNPFPASGMVGTVTTHHNPVETMSKACYVLLQDGKTDEGKHAVKIGVSDDPTKRCETLSAEGPFKFKILHEWPGAGTKLEKRLLLAAENWHAHGEYFFVAEDDLGSFKDAISTAKIEFDRMQKALSELDDAIAEHGEPPSDSKPISGSDVIDAYGEIRAARKRKRMAEDDEAYWKTKIEKIMVMNGASVIEIQDHRGGIGKVSWKEQSRKTLNRSKVKALLDEEAFESCMDESQVRTFLVN